MKIFLISFLFSFSALAADCYVRTVELATREVSLAREICVEGLDLNLEVFGNSKAIISYSLDGVITTKEVNLVRPARRADGRFSFPVKLQSKFAGGMCSDSVEANVYAQLVMNKDGSEVGLEKIEGSVSTSYDNCHMDFSTIQTFSYTL